MFRPLACAFVGCVLIAPLAFAAAPNLGRDIAATCASCHATEAREGGAIPSLTSLNSGAIVERMNEFRDGRRLSTVMQQLAKGYTEAEIEAVAAFLAAPKAN